MKQNIIKLNNYVLDTHSVSKLVNTNHIDYEGKT